MDDARSRSWQRYWRNMQRWAPDARSPIDLFVDRLLTMPDRARWLDAGCGRLSIPPWRARDAARLHARGIVAIGCDIDRKALKDHAPVDKALLCTADLQRLPFRNGTFDFVSSNMVFEHIVRPRETVAELARVTRPAGRILIHTVNAHHYLAVLASLTPLRFHRWIVEKVESRGAEDVYRTQYRANTERRLRQLFDAARCKHTWGGELPDLPMHVPYPGLFRAALFAGLLERRLARIPFVGRLARPNLLMEFERLPHTASTPGARLRPGRAPVR